MLMHKGGSRMGRRVRLVTAALTLGFLAGGVENARAQSNPFHIVENWATLPANFEWGEIADADVDSDGTLWVLHRPPTPGGTAWKEGRTRGGEVPVLKFDKSYKLVKSFGKGLMLQPHGLHVDPEGNIWVTDSGPFYEQGVTAGKGFQVFKFNRDGKLLMTLGKAGVSAAGPDTFVGPTDVLVNARGEIFIADGHTPRPGSPEGDRIVKLSKDGKFLKAWGTKKGSAPGEVAGPHRMAMDSQGRIFVADRGNQRIAIFDQEGRAIDQWAQFGSPSGIWIDKKDVLYVAVPGQKGGIRIGNAKTGTLIESIPDTSPEVAIADPSGNVYSGLVGGQRLDRFVKK
jgi:DNA-binding beta-propeller fold protein YncE